MNWFSKAGKLLFGGGSNGKGVVESVAGAVDEYKYTEEEKAVSEASRYAADTQATAQIMTAPGEVGVGWFDSAVNAVKRLERPAWGVFFFGGFVGWWVFPDLTRLAHFEFWTTVFLIYFTALFGGRMVVKDLLGAVQAMLRKK